MLSLHVSISQQRLIMLRDGIELANFTISTGKAGAGEKNGSGCTPRGQHYVRACIGAGLPSGTVFVGRRPTGEVYAADLAAHYPDRDWILTRILWLCGKEPGRNRGGDVDSQRRYIYIHGTPDTEPMGVPRSHGCIRMRNTDLIVLFDQVQPGTPILIEE